MEKLIIPRDIWLRGDSGNSFLHRPTDGKMCCIGIYLHQLKKIPKEELSAIGAPDQVKVLDLVPEWLIWKDTDHRYKLRSDTIELMRENDRFLHGFSDEDREAKIVGIFLKNDVEVTFVDSLDNPA